jgi:hypothetical protein
MSETVEIADVELRDFHFLVNSSDEVSALMPS